MAKILFLSHRAPFPPDRGDKIRAFNVLQHLAGRHDVWVGGAVDHLDDLHHLGSARERFRDLCLTPLAPTRRATNLVAAAATGAPLSVRHFRHPALARWVRRVLHDVQPDLVFICSSAAAQYFLGSNALAAPLIVDFVDADAEKWRQYAERMRPPRSWMYGEEARRLIRYERRVLDRAVAGLLVSEGERQILSALLARAPDKLHVVPNGVDAAYFHPTTGAAVGAEIVFCGRMDYAPNVDGAEWFVREVLPRIRAHAPQAVFRIVGAAPTSRVLALRRRGVVEVTGAVPDVRPYLSRAAVIVAPLRIARGIQNKVLEGLAAGRPVVVTPQALDGIAAEPGRDLMVGGDAAAFARAVIQVLNGEAQPDLGARGRAFIERHHGWNAQLQTLDSLIATLAPGRSAQAAA